jgi:uncharacterized repeat protein (TIGR02543 family)
MRNYTPGDTEVLYEKTVIFPATSIGDEDFPDDPDRGEAYDFTDWNTQADGGGSSFDETTAVSANVDVYAQWVQNVDTITVSLDAGDGAFSQTSFTVFKGGGTASQIVALEGTGYSNPRWEVDGGLRGTGNSITLNAADYVVGGHILSLFVTKDGISWSKELLFTVDAGNQRTVTFRANDGTGVIHASSSTTEGSALGSFPGVPLRAGYIFTGWNTDPLGDGSPFAAGTTVNADTTVYAQWVGETYTITFMYDTSTQYDSRTVTFPATTIPPGDFPGDPARTDYNFTGWNTQANGTGTPFDENTVVSGDITVRALWVHSEFNVTLSFDVGAGAFSQTDFTLSKSANGNPNSQSVIIDGWGYTNPRWEVDGGFRGTGNDITLNAADYSLGAHYLTLIISKGGVSWSREIIFTITN